MDASKQPGIVFQGVYLAELVFRLAKEKPQVLEYGLNLSVSKRIEDLKEGRQRLLLTMKADPTQQLANKAFEMQVTLVGVFEAAKDSNLTISEFAEKQAPALMVPYLREIISNMTGRSGLPSLMLPPINVHAIIEASKKSPVPPRDPHAD